MENLLLYFAMLFLLEWLLIAQMGQALEGCLSWFLQVFFGAIVLLVVLVLFIFLSLMWFLSAAIKRKQREVEPLATLPSQRSAKQIR